MPPRSPLPTRHGLQAAWVETPAGRPGAWPSLAAWLAERLGERTDVARFLAEGRFVLADGRPVDAVTPWTQRTFVWFHRDLREEPVVPGEVEVLHRDERLVVVDKPSFLATVPRGQHVVQSVVVRMRERLGLPALSPVHRLDRVTAGVLLMTTEPRWRAAYQGLFERREVHKTYRALAPWRDGVAPTVVRDHLVKPPRTERAQVVPGRPPNAETRVEVEQRLPAAPGEPALAVYRLTPLTGRTHQLRVHLAGLGVPIVGDPLYPVVRDVSVDDFSEPLQLLAAELAFTDPVDGVERRFTSRRRLPLPGATPSSASAGSGRAP